jgi:hypothetical protein
MASNLRGNIQIEDIGNHPPRDVARLRCLLASGATTTADPKRNGFYEVESDSTVYYIHITPVTGKILLLATWQNENVPAGGAAQLA